MNKEYTWLLKEKHSGNKTDEFYKDIKKLESGEPLAYVMGNVDFLNIKINLSRKVLIPRVETEFWVQKEIENIVAKNPNCLDIFSGSGCIGISILKNIDGAHVDFADNFNNSIEQIKINIDLNGLNKASYSIIKSDVFSNIKDKYNYIFANPPYISKNKADKIQKSVLDFEPSEALFAEDNGLYFIKELLLNGKKYLRDVGKMYIEIDDWQKDYILEFIKLEKLDEKYSEIQFMNDQFTKSRVIKIVK